MSIAKMKEEKIPKSYKKTEIGIIPEDWEVKRLGEIAIENGFIRGPFGGSLKKEFFTKKGFKVYTQQNAIYRNIELGDYYIDEKKFRELKRFGIKKHDFIISCSGTIGRIFKIPERYKRGIINQALLIIRVNGKIIDEDFFYHYFSWDKFQEKIIDNTQGGAMQNLVGINEFKKILLAYPPRPEQRAIARVLSDIDKLIENIDKLIEKKKLIKKGAMQELLTGKKRLPGFKGEWVRKRVGDLGSCKSGNGFPLKYQNMKKGDYPFFKVSDMSENKNNIFLKMPNNWITENIKRELNATIFPVFTIVFAKIGAAVFLERKRILSQKSCIDNNMMGFIVDYSKADYKYLYYIFNTLSLGQLSETTALPSISKENVENIEISLPPTLEEQCAIAKILSDMDAEIEALEKKKEKYERIKKGTMELLLTGKIRLKNYDVDGG